ncbi:MAG: hypothetical protein H7318_09760 [Oligoflexus sp.]|nr:hypothetical protein [Oligoflexus sp.]
MKCIASGHPSVWIDSPDEVPKYPTCDSIMRPAVVWFGEDLSLAHMKMFNTVLKNCDVFLSIGTSGLVEPASIFMEIAKLSGAMTIVINPDEHVKGEADFYLFESASSGLSKLDRLIAE